MSKSWFDSLDCYKSVISHDFEEYFIKYGYEVVDRTKYLVPMSKENSVQYFEHIMTNVFGKVNYSSIWRPLSQGCCNRIVNLIDIYDSDIDYLMFRDAKNEVCVLDMGSK